MAVDAETIVRELDSAHKEIRRLRVEKCELRRLLDEAHEVIDTLSGWATGRRRSAPDAPDPHTPRDKKE